MTALSGQLDFDRTQLLRLLRPRKIRVFVKWARLALTVLCFLLLITCFFIPFRKLFMHQRDLGDFREKLSSAQALNETSNSGSEDHRSYKAIYEKSVFGKIDETKSTPAEKEKKPKTSLPLALVGTYVSDAASSEAIIENTKKREQDVFSIGDTIFDEAKLISIDSHQVEIERDGKREILSLEDAPDADGSGSPSVSNEGELFVVDESELNTALDNLPLLLTQARAVPYFKDGKSVGLRLFAIKSGSLYEKIGLKNGDILKNINGNSLADITEAMKLFEKLREERSISLEIERNREPVTYQYRIE